MSERLINVQVEFSDGADDWFETFLGKAVVPILKTGLVKQFWFGQYFDGAKRQPRVRFLTDTKSELRHWKGGEPSTALELAIEQHILSLGRELEYDRNKTRADYYSGSRFLSPDAASPHTDRRGSLIFDYLHAVCALHVESLVGPDANGRFRQEKNTDPNNPCGSIFETLHHLLCNTTNLATQVELVVVSSSQILIESPLYWTEAVRPQLQKSNLPFHELGRFKVRF